MSMLRLQHLVYYCQAWHLAWSDRPLFREEIHARPSDVIVPTLLRLHNGSFRLSRWPRGDGRKLSRDERETVEKVLDFYGGMKNAQQRSDLIRSEAPWQEARRGLPANASRRAVVSRVAMKRYYRGLIAVDPPSARATG